MTASLETAWRLALWAPEDDVSPWRVLADLLLGEGDVRGELMQLQLEAEQGPLKGLARVREQAILAEHGAALIPPGVSRDQATFARGVVVDCALRAVHAREPESPLWRTVRRLRFLREHGGRDASEWNATPLTGAQLWRLEELRGVEGDVLPVLARAPEKPRLRLVEFHDDAGFPTAPLRPWREWWAAALPKLPALQEVDYGWAGTAAVAEGRLDALVGTRVARVLQEAAARELAELHRWYTGARPTFGFEVRLRDGALGASVEFGADGLVLRAPPGQLDRAAEAVRRAWPADRPAPRLELVPETPPRRRPVPPLRCATCGDLPDSITANTGRDEYLPSSYRRLQRLWDSTSTAANDALRCPACGAWFEWTDLPQYYGSGNNDEERLERLSPAAAATFERLLYEELGDDAPALLDAASSQLSRSLRDDVLSHVLHARPASFEQRLLGPLVKRFLRPGNPDFEDQSLYGLLYGYSRGNADRSKRVAGLLRSHASPLTGRAKYLLELCEKE